jgi:hypothetical protein
MENRKRFLLTIERTPVRIGASDMPQENSLR